MAICTTAQVLQYFGSNAQQGTTLYAQIDRLRSGVEGRVKKFLKWGLEANGGVPQGQYFGYYDGKNYADIQLRNLFVTVYGVWLDPFGYGGQNTNNYTPFGPGTQLVAGQDYMVINDSDGPAIGVSKSAMIRRLRQNQDLWPSSILNWSSGGRQGLSYSAPPQWPAVLGGIKVNYDFGYTTPNSPNATISSISWANGIATITMVGPVVVWPGEDVTITNDPAWSGGYKILSVATGNTSFTVVAATNPGAFTAGQIDCMPEEIKMATAECVGIMRTQVQRGGITTAETLGDFNFSINTDENFISVRAILSSYRDHSTALGLF